MGIPGLWKILEAAEEGCNLCDLAGQTLAIDLSGWLYASNQEQVHNPHLRNVFHRVQHLLKHQVKPVFVLEGKAPVDKSEVLQRRKNQKDKAAAARQSRREEEEPSSSGRSSSPKGNRGLFGQRTLEVADMLGYMGIPYIQSIGEAEATCAALNSCGLVDGCITNDGDAFLFGAKVVYRNFNCTQAKTGECQFNRCDVADFGPKLKLDRDKLIVLALLVGCDYDLSGTSEVGMEKTMAFLRELNDGNALERVEGWRTNSHLDAVNKFKTATKPNHCSRCGHPGSTKAHRQSRWAECGREHGCNKLQEESDCTCTWHNNMATWKKYSAELKIRTKAMVNETFPSQKVIGLFQNKSHVLAVEKTHLEWKDPQCQKLREFLQNKMHRKFNVDEKLPTLLTAHYLLLSDDLSGKLEVHSILKTSKPRGVDHLRIKWNRIEGLSASDIETDEVRDVFQKHFPQIVKDYETEIQREKDERGKKKSKKRKGKSGLNETPLKQGRMQQYFPAKKRLKFSPRKKPGLSASGDTTEAESVKDRSIVKELDPGGKSEDDDNVDDDDSLPDLDDRWEPNQTSAAKRETKELFKLLGETDKTTATGKRQEFRGESSTGVGSPRVQSQMSADHIVSEKDCSDAIDLTEESDSDEDNSTISLSD